jgi:phosphate starvation-inducible protein PhoH and related proteins
METGYTIVVGNLDRLSALCGANDGNLRAIEDYLGAPIVTRGNELTVASSDAEICRKFQLLVDRIVADSRYSDESPDAIRAILSDIDAPLEGGAESFIQIPQSTKRVYPRTVRQAEIIKRLSTHDVVFLLGPAGTGKTYLAVAEALRMVLSRKVRKIVLTRPVVEAGESLGFLPGDLEQKIDPYLRPLHDAMESLAPPDVLRKMMDSGMIELAPLAYMRGRSLNDSVIILDEAQNTTREQMKMFLTRLGEGSRAIITGDPSQMDLPPRIESGLSHATRVLANIPEIAFVSLEAGDVVRNPLVKKIVQAYEQKTE